MRRIYVGDVQGCVDELNELLDRVAFVRETDRLIFVGDLCRKGPDSAGVLRLAIESGAQSVLGNHEARLLIDGTFGPTITDGACPPDARQARGPDDQRAQDQRAQDQRAQDQRGATDKHGAGKQRKPSDESLHRAPDRDELGAWVAALPVYHREPDVFVVHAAVPPSLWHDCNAEPRADERDFMLRARYCDADGRLPAKDWPPPEAPFAPWHEHYRGAHTVVYGHWARQGLHIGERLRGLDSGCVYGRQLSAWIAEEDRIVQVDARRAYA